MPIRIAGRCFGSRDPRLQPGTATRRGVAALAMTMLLLLVLAPSPSAQAQASGIDAEPSHDVRVSPDHLAGSYRRLDGTTDAVHQACSTNRRQQQETSVAVNPRNPDVIAVAAMDACTSFRNPLPVPQAQNSAAYYRSQDGGETWQASLLPGYPGDLSQPAEAGCVLQASPTLAFDAEGRLYYGGSCLVFAGDLAPVDFQIGVAVFEEDGSRFVRMVRADARSTPADELHTSGDRPSLAVDLTDGPHAGNVYATWLHCRGPEAGVACPPPASTAVSRSTDHGQSFSEPVLLPPGPRDAHLGSDVAVGGDGAVYVVVRARPVDGLQDLLVAKSTDGGRTFSEPVLAATTDPFDSERFRGGSGGDPFGNCGDGPAACASGYTFASFKMFPSIAADEHGVHLVWEEALPGGQGKVLFKSSPDGVDWSAPATAIDPARRGHQWFADVASAAGAITVVYYDSRRDPAYAPDLPPGNTAEGTSSGPAVDTYAARSTDGGKTWRVGRLTRVSSQPNHEIYLDARVPWRGDYNAVSAVPGRAFAVWTDSRDVVAGADTRPDSRPNGFDVHAPCVWVPNTVNGPMTGYAQPLAADPCLSLGGLDQNVYGSWLGSPTGPASRR